jgi:Uma2 family endonuclease
MTLPQPDVSFSPEEYLAWEHQQPNRNEYVRGEVFAMTGVSEAHATITLNFAAALHAHLRGTPCRPFVLDLKLAVDAANCFFYPDIFVTCDPRDRGPDAAYVKRHPKLVIEVLSKSTEAYDRGDKFAAYRMLESLEEYVLVSSERAAIDVFRRDTSGHWVLYPVAPGDTLELMTIGFECPLEVLFEGIEFPGTSPAGQPASYPGT